MKGKGKGKDKMVRDGEGKIQILEGERLPSCFTTNRLSQIFLMRVIIIMKQVLHTERAREREEEKGTLVVCLVPCFFPSSFVVASSTLFN